MTDYALVSSGAGALGLTEATALETVMAAGHRFVAAGGASAGSINGAGVAFGLPHLSRLWQDLLVSGKACDWKSIIPGDLDNPVGILLKNAHGYNGFGMIKGDVIREALHAKLGDVRMGDSLIPLGIVTCNLSLAQALTVSSLNEEHKHIRVVDAVMCSLAVPGVIDAQQLDPASPVLYTDGGVVKNVPEAMWDGLPGTVTFVLRFHEDHTPVKVDDPIKMLKQVFKLARSASEDEVSSRPSTVRLYLPSVADALDFAPTPEACARMAVAGAGAARAWLGGS